MLLDALTNLSYNQDLTVIGAGTAGVSDVLDLSQDRDIAACDVPFLVVCNVVPTSANPTATLTVALETSLDNVTWTALERSGAVPLVDIAGSGGGFVFRADVPAMGRRFLRATYTPSAALTAGRVTASIAADWPLLRAYVRNYMA